jgi:hypothetical protein
VFGRSFPRLKRELEFQLPDGWKGEVVDLSLVGLRIQSVAVLPAHTTVEGHLVLDGSRRIPLKGYVVWSTPPDPAAFVLCEAGIELSDVSDDYRQALAEIFAQD